MKLAVEVNEVVLSNVGTTGEFKIRNSAKAFKILSDGLYSNKIKAIIRELSCNALDSHVAAGKATVPFEVHLPTLLEPWFAVRDFGLGLSGDQVVNIYTTYFESTKSESNDFIGALGLGSKSPFSYTENFTVTAIKDGYKRIYSAFINDAGVPSIAEMSEELTDEGNGVEVKFSVTDRYDYQTFRNEAQNIFIWFQNKPTITGVEFTHSPQVYKEQNITPGVHLRNNSRTSIAVMGNIAYPLDNIPEVNKHFGSLSNLLNCGLVLEFAIGDLDFAASREQLSYIPMTINSIREKLEQLNANLVLHLTAKVDAIDGEWNKAFFLYSEQNTLLYSSVVQKYVADTKFPLYDTKTRGDGRKDFVYTCPDLAKRKLDVKVFRSRHGQSSTIAEHNDYVGSTYVPCRTFTVSSDVVIVLNDLKTGCVARARWHYNNANKSVLVYCVSHADADLAIRQLEYDKLITELHNPPVIIKASELTTKERAKPVSSTGIATICLKSHKRGGNSTSYTWTSCNEVIDSKTTYYYVALDNFEPVDLTGKHINIFYIKALMDECGVQDIRDIKIYGVRKSRIAEIKLLKNWVWIEDKLKIETAKINNDHISSLIAADLIDSYYEKVYTSDTVVKSVGPDSHYSKYITSIKSIKRATGNATQLMQLCQAYGNTLHLDAVKKKIKDDKKLLYKTYPLLEHFRHDNGSVSEKDMADYIKLVDASRKV